MKGKTLISKILLHLTITLFSFSFSAVFAQSSDDLLLKAGRELYEKIDKLDENETIDIYVWKTSINQEDYKEELLKLGFDEDIYGNEDVFQLDIVSKLQEYDKKDTVKEIRKEYKFARLKAIKNVTIATNAKFLEDYGINMNDVIYFSNYTSTIIVTMTRTDILNMIEDERIIGISLYEKDIQRNEIFLSIDQVNAGYGAVQNPGLKNASQGGYDGTGVTIGIIEAASGRFDPDAPQLSSMVSSGQLEFIEVQGVSESISDHATHVTNIIAGQSYTYFGNTYEGIATGAQIYQSAIGDSDDVYTAFSQFADLGVDVINYSGGSSLYGGSYSSYDQEIDNLIYSTKIVFVKSAGNTGGSITSPGKAYNAITVGNVETKIDESTPENSPYDIRWSSSYSVDYYLSNKPELVSPGTYISSVFDTEIYTNTGTSFSAPHVTGVVAQLIQKYGSSVNTNNYITYFKGRLMLGAQASLVADSSHRTGDSTIFFNKQGAGFLDATNSAKSIAGWNKYVRLSTLSLNYYVYIFTPPMDFSIRAVLIFEKPENSQITSNYGNNLNLYLQSPGGTIFSSSTSSTNIFEMLEYTIPANQDILLRVNRAAYISSSLYISISCFWMGV
jgi:subtilisin family serine protease